MLLQLTCLAEGDSCLTASAKYVCLQLATLFLIWMTLLKRTFDNFQNSFLISPLHLTTLLDYITIQDRLHTSYADVWQLSPRPRAKIFSSPVFVGIERVFNPFDFTIGKNCFFAFPVFCSCFSSSHREMILARLIIRPQESVYGVKILYSWEFFHFMAVIFPRVAFC